MPHVVDKNIEKSHTDSRLRYLFERQEVTRFEQYQIEGNMHKVRINYCSIRKLIQFGIIIYETVEVGKVVAKINVFILRILSNINK